MKILIVEDEETMVTSLRAFLSREGYQVVAARDGLEGVEAVRTMGPDLVLLYERAATNAESAWRCWDLGRRTLRR